MYVYMYVYVHVRMGIGMCSHMYIYIYICRYVYVCICIYIYFANHDHVVRLTKAGFGRWGQVVIARSDGHGSQDLQHFEKVSGQ